MSARWVLVTRAEEELRGFREVLEPAGYAVVAFPVLLQRSVRDEDGWTLAQRVLPQIRAVAFTSPRAPEPFVRAATSRGLSPAVTDLPAVAVGETTARAAAASGLKVEAVGGTGGCDLAVLLQDRCKRGAVVLHPCGREHRPELAEALAKGDIQVVPLIVYAMDLVPPSSLPPLPAGRPAAVLLTSPRAAEGYMAACGARLAQAPHLVMGITSAMRARELGIDAVVLRRPSPAALLEELCRINS